MNLIRLSPLLSFLLAGTVLATGCLTRDPGPSRLPSLKDFERCQGEDCARTDAMDVPVASVPTGWTCIQRDDNDDSHMRLWTDTNGHFALDWHLPRAKPGDVHVYGRVGMEDRAHRVADDVRAPNQTAWTFPGTFADAGNFSAVFFGFYSEGTPAFLASDDPTILTRTEAGRASYTWSFSDGASTVHFDTMLAGFPANEGRIDGSDFHFVGHAVRVGAVSGGYGVARGLPNLLPSSSCG